MAADARVRLVLAAAARVVDAITIETKQAIANESGISLPNVERALARHVETSVTDAELASLGASVPPASTVHVLLSAHVFVAPVRALALAFAAAPRVRVRASRRSLVFPSLLVDAIGSSLDVARVDDLAIFPGDHVHAYGSGEALAVVRAALPAGATLWAHGPGFGVAALDERGVDDLVSDVVVFDQRGCLSPMIAFVLGSDRDARALADKLAARLLDARSAVPLGNTNPIDRAADARFTATMAMTGGAFGGFGARVGLDLEGRNLGLPSAPRSIVVVRVRDEDHARALLAPSASLVTIVGGEGTLADALAETAPAARRSALGSMQRPPLDGPVDRRPHG